VTQNPVYAMLTGHRPDKLGGYGPSACQTAVRAALCKLLSAWKAHAQAHGASLHVISGMALGADQWWAEEAITLGIPVHAYAPFDGQDARWPRASQTHYRMLLTRCASVRVVTSGAYAAWKMQRRNEAMVDDAQWHVAVWDGSNGGTANCVAYMRARGIEPTVIAPRGLG